MVNREQYIYKRIREHYNFIKDKYEVVGIFLQGSQNYELDIYDDEYKSDIDTKAIILPSFEDVVYNRTPISTTIVLDNNEHIDVKDIRVMFDTLKKQNINFLEILFTKFKIINPKYKGLIQPLFDNNEIIARYDINKNLNCQCGMSEQKLVALKHPYPTIIEKIEKYGYDPKQLHHILRIKDFINKFVNGKSYKECLIPDNKDWLIKVKKGVLPLEDAEELAKQTNQEIYKIAKSNIKDNIIQNEFAASILDNVKYDILKQYFTEDLMNGNIKKKFIPNKIFVTSDNHFFHEKIIQYEHRPFMSVKNMNEQMIKNWNNVVTDLDLVYIVGDFSFGSVKATNELLKKLNGKKILIKGNHDTFVDNSKFDKTLFEEITECKTIIYKNIKFTLCHYPFASNDDKTIQLYGHIHSNTQLNKHSISIDLLPHNSYNVGVDVNNYMPINIERIYDLFYEKIGDHNERSDT